MPRYICSNNSAHTYDHMTADGFCPVPDCYGVGFLQEAGASAAASAGGQPQGPAREIGLCVLLMDASASMQEEAFPGNPATREQLIAVSAARGIFDLHSLQHKETAYLIVVTFDSSHKVVLACSLAELFAKYPTPAEFADFLKSSFTHGTTDINSVLRYAKGIYDDFVTHGDLSKYGGPTNVRPIQQTVVTKNLGSKVVPNIRVLIYTDGEDTTSGDIRANPFAQEETDVLLGAYFGHGEEVGCTQLKRVLSKCPKHAVDQFFLINSTDRVQTLRYLFRMASGASGFCPACLAEGRAAAPGSASVVP